MLGVIILLLSVVVGASIGMFVFARNPRHIINRLYGLLTLSLVLFPIANYFSLQQDHKLFYIRIVIFLSTLIFASLFYLVLLLGDEHKPLKFWPRAGLYYTVFVALLTLTPLVFKDLTGGANPTPVPNFGAVFFFAHFLIFPLFSFITLVRRMRKSKGIQRLQFMYLLLGITPMALFAPITGFVMPVMLKNSSLIILSPLYTAFFVSLVGYAILKHKLFDVRFFVVRASAYVLTMLLLSAVYVGPILYLVCTVVLGIPLGIGQFLLAITIASMAAIFYERARVWFDKVTARIFFRNAYDPERFIAELNRTVVSTLELETLLTRTSTVIAQNFKIEYCTFILEATDASPQRTVGTEGRRINGNDLQYIQLALSSRRSKVVVADYLGPEQVQLQQALQRNNISVLARLAPEDAADDKGLGYMMLGAKKSGGQFNSRDSETLQTIIDGLIVAIQNAVGFAEIQNFTVTLQSRINEATRELRRTNAKLKTLDETKDDFISMASHQLRTPLTSIKGYISMVLEGDAGDLTPLQRKMLDQAFVSSQRMVFLIADLLNISRLKTGKFVIEPLAVDLTSMVADEVDQLRSTAASRQLELSYDRPAGFPELMLDETKTRQVVMNFIDNAIYYTPAGGRIHVELTEKNESIEFRVIDNGMGVPKAEQPHLFMKFYRAANARRARPDGTGLGLFMAKKVIAAQGGAVIFESREGKGSTFGFIFPKAKLAIPSPAKQ